MTMELPNKIDLHIHTTVSDGTDPPEDIIGRVKAAGLELFSVTDHDAVKSSRRVLKLLRPGDPAFLTGIEFSCRDEKGKDHILGYGYDPDSESMRRTVGLGHGYRMKKVRARLEFLAKEFGFTIHGGMYLNVMNSEALQQYRNMGLEDVTLSFELVFSESGRLAAPDTGFVIYGYLPLMKFRNCPAQGKNGCGSCSGINELVDRKGEHFPIICRERQYSELLNCVPLYVGDRRRPDAGFETLYFTIETREQCREVYEAYTAGAPADFRRTAGLYFREVL